MAETPKNEEKYGQIFFAWKIPEYTQHQRSSQWYMVMIALALILIVYSIFTQNFLFALIIILIVFIIFLREYIVPRDLKFLITEDGIVLGERLYPYREIKSFYFVYDPPAVKKIYFTLKKGINPIFSVPLNDLNPLALRERLLIYLDEDLEQENQTLDDQLETILKL
jgi:hypothetical protein